MKNTLLLCFFVLSAALATAQNSNNSLKGVVYDREQVLDVRLHTYGYTIAYQKGKLKTYYRTDFTTFQFGEFKDFRQTKRSSDISFQSGGGFDSYTYGKQNNLFVLRAGYGKKRYFTDKASKKGVSVAMIYEGGVSLGMLKPYYLDVNISTENGRIDIQPIRYEPKDTVNAARFLDPNSIFDGASVFKGINQIKFVPGIHGQVGLHIDAGAFDEFVRAGEIGLMLDIFPRKMPMMILEDNRPYFLNLYVSLQLGKRK